MNNATETRTAFTRRALGQLHDMFANMSAAQCEKMHAVSYKLPQKTTITVGNRGPLFIERPVACDGRVSP